MNGGRRDIADKVAAAAPIFIGSPPTQPSSVQEHYLYTIDHPIYSSRIVRYCSIVLLLLQDISSQCILTSMYLHYATDTKQNIIQPFCSSMNPDYKTQNNKNGLHGEGESIFRRLFVVVVMKYSVIDLNFCCCLERGSIFKDHLMNIVGFEVN